MDARRAVHEVKGVGVAHRFHETRGARPEAYPCVLGRILRIVEDAVVFPAEPDPKAVVAPHE